MAGFYTKCKAVTFSYDDGVTQDRRLIQMFDRYGLKATFNLNSGLLGKPGEVKNALGTAAHNKVAPDEVKTLYANHEVAVHTVNHYNLTTLDDDEIARQVEQDRLALQQLTGKPVVGMAYPCGGVNNDERVAAVLRTRTTMRYARTITANDSFAPQTDLLRFNPTVWHLDFDKMFALAEQFLALPADPEHPALFYIWGHSYEFDYNDSWGKMEEFCRFISGKDDVFYGTNREVLL